MSLSNEALWCQYGAAIDELGLVLADCPDDLWEMMLWNDHPDQWMAKGFSTFWYLGYHAIFWLDIHLFGSEDGFAPPAPYPLVEMQPHETLPAVLSKQALLDYLALCRQKCKDIVLNLTPEQAARICTFPWGEPSYGELQLYNLRHLQEHAAQLKLFLGQQTGYQSQYVTRAEM